MFERYVRFKRISVDRDKEKERGISCLTLPVRKGAPFVGRSRSLTSRGIAARPQRCSRIYRIMKTLIASKQDDTTIRSRGWAERKSYLAPATTSPRTFYINEEIPFNLGRLCRLSDATMSCFPCRIIVIEFVPASPPVFDRGSGLPRDPGETFD